MIEPTPDLHRSRNHALKGLLVLTVLAVIFALGFMMWPRTEDGSSLPADKDTVASSSSSESTSQPAMQRAVSQTAESASLDNGAVDIRTGWSDFKINHHQTNDEDTFRKRLRGFALSEEEARWMDRNGVPAPTQVNSSYADMSLEKLMQLARGGDPIAARIGALRTRYAQWTNGVGAEIHRLSMPSRAPGQEHQPPTDDDRRQLDTLMGKLFQTEDWNLFHEFLWQGVVNGSSHAALSMRRAYWDASNTCYKPRLCEAWGMVAWRMGKWDAQPGGPVSLKYAGITLSVSAVMTQANFLWAEINKARADRGLAPLQIDLRPNFEEWQQWEKHPEETKRIYRR